MKILVTTPQGEIFDRHFPPEAIGRLKVLGDVRLNQNTKQLTRDELKKLLSGHLCRCTGYENIINAVEKTMNKRLSGKEGK